MIYLHNKYGKTAKLSSTTNCVRYYTLCQNVAVTTFLPNRLHKSKAKEKFLEIEDVARGSCS